MATSERQDQGSSPETIPSRPLKKLLGITDLTPAQIYYILDIAENFKVGGEYFRNDPTPLAGKTVVLFFEKPSLRTKLSLQRAVTDLGGNPVILTNQEVQIGSRETAADVAGVLERMAHAVVARVNDHYTLEELAKCAPRLPLINALSDQEHPLQILADLQTMSEKKGRLKGLSVTYVGDGNNVANSLALACATLGMNFNIASPRYYQLEGTIVKQAIELNKQSGGMIFRTDDPALAVEGTDVVYTDTWISMGQDQERKERLQAFKGYQVTEKLMALAKPDAIFMHCMPAHRDQEVTPGVIDGPQSVIFDQAENRLHTAKAVLATLVR